MNNLLHIINNLDIHDHLEIDKDQLLELTSSVPEIDIILGRSRRSISSCSTADLPFEFEYSINGIQFYGTKESYQTLGLCFLSLLFEDKDYLELTLNSKKSIVPKLFLHYNKEDLKKNGLNIRKTVEYKSFTYIRNIVGKFPFSKEQKMETDHLPLLLYGWNSKNYIQSYEEQIENADHLILSLNKNGICDFSSLLLNISHPKNNQKEICFESPTLGFGGVKENSLEMRLWLPDSFGFPQGNLEDLDVNGLKRF